MIYKSYRSTKLKQTDEILNWDMETEGTVDLIETLKEVHRHLKEQASRPAVFQDRPVYMWELPEHIQKEILLTMAHHNKD